MPSIHAKERAGCLRAAQLKVPAAWRPLTQFCLVIGISYWHVQYQWIQLKPDVSKQTLPSKPSLQHPLRGFWLDIILLRVSFKQSLVSPGTGRIAWTHVHSPRRCSGGPNSKGIYGTWRPEPRGKYWVIREVASRSQLGCLSRLQSPLGRQLHRVTSITQIPAQPHS